MPERMGLAAVALALGVLGLFTAGGLGLGSLLGLVLAVAVLLGPPGRGARNVAWAALAANAFALLTVVPISAALVAYRAAPFTLFEDEDALPVPATPPAFVDSTPALPPPPPPPPPTLPAATAGGSRTSPALGATGGAEAPPAAVRVGGAIAEPRKIRHVNPAYPKAAVESRIQGVVVLECTISPTGKVVDVRTVRGTELLTEAAIEAVRQWEYTPTLLNGVAVPVIMTVTVNFTLG